KAFLLRLADRPLHVRSVRTASALGQVLNIPVLQELLSSNSPFAEPLHQGGTIDFFGVLKAVRRVLDRLLQKALGTGIDSTYGAFRCHPSAPAIFTSVSSLLILLRCASRIFAQFHD